ncbi:MAG: HNH endonuclease [Chloroflexi bacterium]|nr:HNH endonuclease [Chloroflexota bacterium]
MPDRRVTPTQRIQIAERADNRCEYCQTPDAFAIHTYNVEHIIPRVKDGQTILSNLAYSCSGCNSLKHTKTAGNDPITNEIAPLYNPRQDRWSEHFAWKDNLLQIVGLTATGRTTIAAIQLNRPGLMNLRRALLAISEHPATETE